MTEKILEYKLSIGHELFSSIDKGDVIFMIACFIMGLGIGLAVFSLLWYHKNINAEKKIKGIKVSKYRRGINFHSKGDRKVVSIPPKQHTFSLDRQKI